MAVPASREEREASAQHYSFIEERLLALDDLRANGAGFFSMQQFQWASQYFFAKYRYAWRMRIYLWVTSHGLFVVANVITLALAIYLLFSGKISLGSAYLLFQYMLMFEEPIEELGQQMQELQNAAAAIYRVQELFDTPKTLSNTGQRHLASQAHRVAFKGVNFAYEEAPILQGVDFELAQGQKLGIMGRTGSGKSTLSKLLFRFYDVKAGGIYLDGEDIRELELHHLRKRVGFVTQDVQLFHASVRDNLSFFSDSYSDAQLLGVLEHIGLSDWLTSLPQGLDSIIDRAGGNVSAGEAQLLAFARVFLKDPGLIILDEPSSRLDPESEAKMERALEGLLANRTAIIIAHRLESLAKADDILVLNDGKVVEYGGRGVLEQNPRSRYAQMLQKSRSARFNGDIEQLLDDNEEAS